MKNEKPISILTEENKPITIWIVEDDEDFQFLIQQTIEMENDMTVLGSSSTPEDALSKIPIHKPDVVLMDLNLKGSASDGMETSRQIRLQTDSKILILTSFEDPDIVVQAAVRGLAHGYVFKSQFELLVESVRKTARGVTPQQHLIHSLILSCLTPAEYSVFQIMLGKELTLQSSPKTIANQKTMVLKKLDLPSQSALLHVFRYI